MGWPNPFSNGNQHQALAFTFTDEQLELGAEFHLVIPIENGPGRQEELRIDARCTWSGHDVNPDLLCAGFEFEEVRPRQEEALARIIQRNRFENQHS